METNPNGGLVLDAAGNLYGTTQFGGKHGFGTAFQLTPGPGGWVESVIHNFGGPGDPACCPWGNLILERGNNLYGTGRVAFELSPGPNDWTEGILHNFLGQNGDGYDPFAGPIMDSGGNLFGTTWGGRQL